MAEVMFKPGKMNNVADPSNVGEPDKSVRNLVYTEGCDLLNLDPSNAFSASLRWGRGAPLIESDALHSGWSNPYNPIEAFWVDDGKLKRMAGGVVTTIREGLRTLPVSFVQVNDIVRWGNGEQSGIVEFGLDAEPYAIPDMFERRNSRGNVVDKKINPPQPTTDYKDWVDGAPVAALRSDFKLPMVHGHFLEFYNGRLYALQDNVLYCSDPLDTPGGIEVMDRRFNVVAVFDGPGQMLQRTGNGLIVSANGETFFFYGDDPFVGEGFTQRSLAPYPAIAGTAQPIMAELLGIEGWRGWAAVWFSEQGVCACSSEGVFHNITKMTTAFPGGEYGSAVVRQAGGVVHYLMSLIPSDATYNPFNPFVPRDVTMIPHMVNQV